MDCLFYDSTYSLFNDGWLFTEPGGNEKKEVTLPHSWNSVGWTYEDEGEKSPSGTGVYEKVINGNDLEGSVLKFEGVSAYCEIFLNGKKIYENLGAYKPFEVLLSGLCSGGNILSVTVTDKTALKPLSEGCDEIFSKSPRYKRWPAPLGSSLEAGGIWRNVNIIKRGDVYIKPFIIEPNGESFVITSNLNKSAEGFTVRCSLYDGVEKTETTIPAKSETFEMTPENPVLSWPLHPHLYEFTAELVSPENEVIQTIKQPAMLMKLSIRNSDFLLNNKPYFLRGQNGFAHCNVPHDTEYIKSYVSAYKNQGVEISRFHTEPPSHAWLDECDRQGIMVILEMPLHGSFGCYSYGSEEFSKNTLDEILSIVKEYQRHPSVAIWCMGNELIVAAERDLGLGKPLFDILEKWIDEVHKLDKRPVISNSNGDASNLVNKSVGEIDDIHQYGGWYVENIYDLRHFKEYTLKNDMLFQPCISTESIAGYTNENEEFFLSHSDIRQKKIVAMRLGEIYNLKEQSRNYQSFLLKEYAEAMWRLRVSGSSFSGYIPFGQYTWFFKPFDKDGLVPKSIWQTYKKVMAPVHIQLECFSRHITKGEALKGNLRLWHENVHLPKTADFTVKIYGNGTLLKTLEYTVNYHESVCEEIEIEGLETSGTVLFEVYCDKKQVSSNDIEFKVYQKSGSKLSDDLIIYDPDNTLDITGKRINSLREIKNFKGGLLCVGPYSLDSLAHTYSGVVNEWIKDGGRAVVLEQNPGYYTEDMFGSKISAMRVCQPRWSRWAMNLVKHADRMDIVDREHRMFKGINESDLFWWNGDTYLSDSYLLCTGDTEGDRILSEIGNGLSSEELMPVKYEYKDSGYSVSAVERKIGKGSVIFTSLLIGTKHKTEPVARKILDNLLGS